MKKIILLLLSIVCFSASANVYHLGTQSPGNSGWFALNLSTEDLVANTCYNDPKACINGKSGFHGLVLDENSYSGTVTAGGFTESKYKTLKEIKKATQWRATRTLRIQCLANPDYTVNYWFIHIEIDPSNPTRGEIDTHDGLHVYKCRQARY